ncbi:MAG: hypothetical protein ACD_38C00179G0003 [uncultured bacterium]|uniref:Uncharacterized protein n=1 Tax=Candidatus Daviesbacteria bacterium GW2011_GWC2_40_12 TaxID=1618431 RepID=A0A0G0QY94_9BACT|nr:MAG: hypothetical protein ACD_38C00179G0003 [uncultured bacterium]KKQ82644.1 MAG: hypothetical protein UT04_C0053G0005 [Candidatus Daviesbacteria bacterium GW2011_GWF2_38_7]KKR16782.1 MAG: hypothetical protein UT45_C0004G0113 [Candidatus Daviesbacteria bacterium GW2011_GWA2_39_33]KKR42436.1 MAG: hypothetical protein UT77_C0002G0089 [Candidatus Daviesbacteria bacterium GW2011_GWC2_40_12]OGE22349.1 MAG: hypothetical protein A2778_00695 [Candidatus Daviesbacteria bacterium RIFCSPHIGHO2_01_FULL_
MINKGKPKIGEAVSGLGGALGDVVSGVAGKVGDTVSGVEGTLDETLEGVKGGVSGAVSDMGKKAEEAVKHIDEHVMYPASKGDILAACNEMTEVPEEEKKWVSDRLPDKTYQSPQEVKAELYTGQAA